MSNEYKLHLNTKSDLPEERKMETRDALDLLTELSGYLRDAAVLLNETYLPIHFGSPKSGVVEIHIYPDTMYKILKSRPGYVPQISRRTDKSTEEDPYEFLMEIYLVPEPTEQYPETRLFCIGSKKDFESAGLNIEEVS